MRTFKLTDDCTLSGVRLLPDDRRIDGGGYFYPEFPGRLVPAHGVVEVPVGEVVGRRLRKGERVVVTVSTSGWCC